MDINDYIDPEVFEEELFTVTIIDHYSSAHYEYQEEVGYATLRLMLQADYVTVRGKTLQKKSTRVDDKGDIYFYGIIVDENTI